jgi:hypothetical protein
LEFLFGLKSSPQLKQWQVLLKNGRGKPRSKTEIANACPESLGLDTSIEEHEGHFISD